MFSQNFKKKSFTGNRIRKMQLGNNSFGRVYRYPGTTRGYRYPGTTRGYRYPGTTRGYRYPGTTRGYRYPGTTRGYRYPDTRHIFLNEWIMIQMSLHFILQREGTLMGTAVGIGFGYWFLASGLYYGVSFICNTHITFLQVLSLTVSNKNTTWFYKSLLSYLLCVH